MNRAGKTGYRRTRRGAALVEMAIVLVLLSILLFGIIDFGLLIRDYLALSHVAREGARTFAVGATESDMRADIMTWAGKMGLKTDKITIDNVIPANPNAGVHFTVSLSYDHPMFAFRLLKTDSEIRINSTIIMRKE